MVLWIDAWPSDVSLELETDAVAQSVSHPLGIIIQLKPSGAILLQYFIIFLLLGALVFRLSHKP